MKSGLYEYLKSLADLRALVEDRIYPVRAPQGAVLPHVTYQQVAGVRVRTFDGPCGMGNPRFQIDCWGRTYASVSAVAEAIRGTYAAPRMDGYTGLMGMYWVQSAEVVDSQDSYEKPQRGEDLGTYRVRLDVEFWYDE